MFDVSASYETIRQWVLTAKKPIVRRENSVATNWHADETYIKIEGRGFWLWIVYCRDTKRVLAWHISDSHLLKHARKVMKDALNIAGEKPLTITTDGLWQYPVGIYKEMGWSWQEHRKRHIIDSGIGKNAVIERVNREVKRRVKFFSTFQAIESAQAFFGLWFYHFNQHKSSHTT